MDAQHPTEEDRSLRIKEDYLRWSQRHTKMKETPPPDGRDYLAHASTLLSLLQGVTEIHPIVKAVVSSFQTILVFEQARRENDARVTAVFLVQTDMMRVLLDMDDLDHRHECRADLERLRSNAALTDTLYRVQQSIKSCGNSIDTYYKESRFVKFWKAQDWKARMLGHVEDFNRHRMQLQQILSIQVASGVNDLVTKMDLVLARLFSPKHDWEKELDGKTRRLGSIDTWVNDSNTLQSLIASTKDPALAMPAPASDLGEASAPGLFVTVRLEQIQKELESSLDALCAKNLDWFNLKLDFQMQQIQESIYNSAQFVVHNLSGPYDRLHHEDLRKLWREMNWIFCIENKFFASALFEYYLDQFSTTTRHVYSDQVSEINEASMPATLDAIRAISVTTSKHNIWSKTAALNHPDGWTLEYIALYGERIGTAIDADKSGYIRISEVNTLTDEIPKGWNLPQWCAYLAAGWAYEARIYRKRINNLLFKLMEMQAHVLPNNRTYLINYQTSFFDDICHAFCREPPFQHMPYIAAPLRSLVKDKILAQDADLRSKLDALRWTLEDESAIHLIFGNKEPETYILQICTVILEYVLEVAFACCCVTIDAEEWERLSRLFRVMRSVGVNRVNSLTAAFEEDPDKHEGISTYYGGIWSLLETNEDHQHYMFGSRMISSEYTKEQLYDYLSDIEVLKDYPLPTAETSKPLLHFITWEEHVKTLEESEIPDYLPETWLSYNAEYFYSLHSRSFLALFPLSGAIIAYAVQVIQSTYAQIASVFLLQTMLLTIII
ncbi:hypothetical protein CPC08DRAFT_760974 [Agrocybe pediades]|nr:hypothetical protein CPC08DRAFT_760974 [Agrocybe pediades]